MAILYFIALIPFFIGLGIWAVSREVNWWEWLVGSAAAFALAGIIQMVGMYSVPSDVQTFSGRIIEAKHFTRWQEYYEEAVYRTESYTTGTGKNRTRHTRRVFDHWESETRWHNDDYRDSSNINTQYSIGAEEYHQTVKLFGGEEKVRGDRTTNEHNSKMIAGDAYDRVSIPKTGYVLPITDARHWENRLRCGPSVYSFIKVPSTVPVFEWPANPSPWVSGRLMGTAGKGMSIYDWDKLNAELGPLKKVNLIAIGFGDGDSSLAQYQRAKFVGGKKNDLVICFGGDAAHPTWVNVFGWTDSELVKQNLQTLVLQNGFSKATIPAIKDEVIKNYVIKDWSVFQSIEVPCTTGLLVTYIIFTILIQVGIYWWAMHNEFQKANSLTLGENTLHY